MTDYRLTEETMSAPPNIPDYWSAEQALAVFELLDTLRDQVWELYATRIQQQWRLDCQDDFQPDLFDHGDEPPF
jgi:hypothetical protein